MTTRDFCYWLQGALEISDPKNMDEREINVIKAHLNMVFIPDIDPSMGDETHQTKLDDAHNAVVEPVKSDPYIEAIKKFGPCPVVGYKLSILHGWYDPEGGRPRC